MSDNNSGPQSASTQIKPLPYEGRACSRRDTFVARERQHLLTITVLANVRSSSSSAQQRSLSPRWVLSLPHRVIVFSTASLPPMVLKVKANPTLPWA